jgi:hypothetical protein
MQIFASLNFTTMNVSGTVYQITRKDTMEVLLEGLVRHSGDTIYPAQDEPYLLDEFPNLSFQCELYNFQCDGLAIDTFDFCIPVSELAKYKI